MKSVNRMKSMNRMFRAALLAAFMAGIASCSKDDDGPHLSVETSEGTEFSTTGGAVNVSVTSDATWRIDGLNGDAAGWLATDVSQGKGSRYVRVYAKANTTIYERDATLVFVCTTNEDVSQSVTFHQAGLEPMLAVTPTTVVLSPYESSTPIRIECNTSWQAGSGGDWLTLSADGGQGSSSLRLKVGENTDNDERKALVTVYSEESHLSQQIEVTQEGMSTQLYREPMVKWGTTKDGVKGYMNSFDIYEDVDSRILFNGKYKEVLTGYLFDGGKLWNSIVTLKSSAVNASALDGHLQRNKYKSAGTSMYEAPLYNSTDGKTLVILDYVSGASAYYVRYYDYSVPFKAPCTLWQATMTKVKSVMSGDGYSIADEGTESGMRYVAYNPKRLELGSVYLFNAYSMLKEADILFDPAIVPFEKVCSHLTSSLSYTSSSGLSSAYGNVYESSDRNTVALVFQSRYVPQNRIQVSFVSREDAYSSAKSRPGGMARGDISDFMFERIGSLPEKVVQRQMEIGYRK